MPALRLALCQINLTVGDIAGNEQRIREALDTSRAAGAQLAVFPELTITGYPPEDLLLKRHFLRDARAALDRLAAEARDIVAIVGFPDAIGGRLYNAAAALADGHVAAIHHKIHLPNYGVFDEQRYFHPGDRSSLIELGPHRIGLTVCEDVWAPGPPASAQVGAGATLIVNLSASPYHAGKGVERELLFARRAREHRTPIAFCGLVGGQDELVFDGHSFVLDAAGEVIARAAAFAEEVLVCQLELPPPHAISDAPPAHPAAESLAGISLPPAAGDRPLPRIAAVAQPIEAEIYAALKCGLRDYVGKNGFRHTVLGLSGGIDSALVAAIAVDALGPERVSTVVMPSPYSSAETQGDARALAATLGVECVELPIAGPMDAYAETLAGVFARREPDLTEENIQARIRGNLLMALSNKFGWLVLTTGNKSEMSVGYSTLYGDSAGGFAVIKDCEKTLVFRLARWRGGIPDTILDRPPSAELRPDQRDDETLPPYDLLDTILRRYVEEVRGRDELVASGLDPDAVDRVIGLVDRAEYKRRQAPPGIKITERAFGRDRRMPITNRYRG